jgi:hypothetical protein
MVGGDGRRRYDIMGHTVNSSLLYSAREWDISLAATTPAT